MKHNEIDEGYKEIIIKHLKYFFRLILICSISTILSIAMSNAGIGKENTLMVFLVGVLTVTSVTRGYIYGAVAGILSVLLFNYFLTQPIHTLIISYSQDFILIVFFLIASLISSTMTSKFQYQTEVAKSNERTARLLYEITKGFLNVTGKENIILKGINYINDYVGYSCYVKLYNEEKIFCTPGLDNYMESKQKQSYKIPIKGVANEIGTMEIMDIKLPMSSENNMIIKTIVYQMALVLDREFIYDEREKIKIAMESERLKSTLLRSVSHDLRTPLTGIVGASELILDSYDNLDLKSIKKLVSDIKEESIWLIKSVQNILDMTRISEGKLTVNKNYEAVDDLINQALTHVPQLTSSDRFHVFVPDDIIIVMVDGRLIVQVLVNILDNAYKHTNEDTEIELKVYKSDMNVIFEVADNGEGIDLTIIDTLFEGFVTYHKDIADGSRGVGLGLAICKAIITAHDGAITASNKKTGGALFKISLPIEEI
nr:ATP-binding protein [Sedimentibacter sp.]